MQCACRYGGQAVSKGELTFTQVLKVNPASCSATLQIIVTQRVRYLSFASLLHQFETALNAKHFALVTIRLPPF